MFALYFIHIYGRNMWGHMGPTQPPPITSITSISPLSPTYTPLSLFIGHIHRKSTDGHQHLLKHEAKRDQENREAIWP